MKRSGLVYSTDPNFEWEKIKNEDTVNKADFILSVCFEKKGRAGKGVTIIKGFEGPKEKISSLAKVLKKLLGVGGSVKKNEIIIQGRIQDKIMEILQKEGYKTKKVGG